MKAKAGDTIETKARERMARAQGQRPLDHMPTVVEPKTEGDAGQWFCITCGELPQNQMQAGSHETEHPKHKLAWRSFASGNIEAP